MLLDRLGHNSRNLGVCDLLNHLLSHVVKLHCLQWVSPAHLSSLDQTACVTSACGCESSFAPVGTADLSSSGGLLEGLLALLLEEQAKYR